MVQFECGTRILRVIHGPDARAKANCVTTGLVRTRHSRGEVLITPADKRYQTRRVVKLFFNVRKIGKPSIWVAAAIGLASLCVITYANWQWFLQDSRNGTVGAAGSMSMKRAAHTATLLPNGDVLIAGGMERAEGNEINTATAELYDYRSRSFVRTGSMSVARAGHTATLLPNGDVLITGGFDDGKALASAEIYHAQTRTFTATSAMSVARDRHAATRLQNGAILITGGNRGQGVQTVETAEVYDPAKQRFEIVGSMHSPRSAHAATLLDDGRVLITGGSRERFAEVLNSAEVYHPVNQGFQTLPNMNAPRHKQASTLLADGRVLVSGGSDNAREMGGREATSEIFDPKQNTFVLTGPMAAARFKFTSAVVLIANGNVIVAGDGNYAEVYHPTIGAYGTALGRLDSAWMYASAAALPDGSVLITGGYDASMRITEGAWLYRPPPQVALRTNVVDRLYAAIVGMI